MLLKNNWSKSEMFSGERRVKLSCSCSSFVCSPLMISLTASRKSLAMMRSFLIAAGLGTPPPNFSQVIISETAPPCPMLWPPNRSSPFRWDARKMKCARLQPYTYDSTCTENYIIMTAHQLTSPVDALSFLGKVPFRALTLPSPRPSGH